MKRLHQHIISSIILTTTLVSCSDKYDPSGKYYPVSTNDPATENPYFSIETNPIQFSPDGGERDIDYATNRKFLLSTNSDNFIPKKNGDKITITCLPSTNGNLTKSQLYITDSLTSYTFATIELEQFAASFSFESSQLNFNQGANEFLLAVSNTNCSWSAEITTGADWIHILSQNSSGLHLVIDENDSGASRMGYLRAYYAGKYADCIIFQFG